MSKSYFMTPEEIMVKKKRQKVILYVSFVAMTIVLTSVLTILANQM